MPNRNQTNLGESFGERSLSDLARSIADPNVHVGGGTAAAASAALAAATAELVVTLSSRRKSNRADRPEIDADRVRLGELAQAAKTIGAEDERALADLMASYSSNNRPSLDRATLLLNAAKSTLGISTIAVEIMEIAERQAGFATRFTVSDLGAASALAYGATVSGLLTARININLLEKEEVSGDHRMRLADLRDSVDSTESRAAALFRRTVAFVSNRIDPNR